MPDGMSMAAQGARALRSAALTLVLLALLPQDAEATLAANASIVYVRKDCTGIANCERYLSTVLQWMMTTRRPQASSPLLVDLGPGDFRETKNDKASQFLNCSDGLGNPTFGYTTFRGAGRDRTVIGNDDGHVPGVSAGLQVIACEGLTFQDLTVEGSGRSCRASSGTTVGARGGSNTTLRGTQTGWYDVCQATQGNGDTSPQSLHYFFNSRIEATGDIDPAVQAAASSHGYVALCAENWFYSSEIVARATRADATDAIGIELSGTADARLFASRIRVEAAAGVPATATIAAARLGVTQLNSGAETQSMELLHFHAGAIEVDTSAVPGLPAIGILAASHPEGDPGGMVHTPGAAFRLKAGGNVVRLQIVGSPADPEQPMIMSPFRWDPGSEPRPSSLSPAPTSSSRPIAARPETARAAETRRT